MTKTTPSRDEVREHPPCVLIDEVGSALGVIAEHLGSISERIEKTLDNKLRTG